MLSVAMSRYEASEAYLYPGTTVLRNKAEITEQESLDAFEADITAIRILELTEVPVKGRFDLDHLRAIHRYVFQDIYDWAGELRTVDISREQSRFANINQIEPYARTVFRQLAGENYLQGIPVEKFAARLAHYMAEINALHPFRDGNGRVQRVFASQLAEDAGYFLDYSALTQEAFYEVMKASFFGDEKPLANLLLQLLVASE